jgi:hypothetical protein
MYFAVNDTSNKPLKPLEHHLLASCNLRAETLGLQDVGSIACTKVQLNQQEYLVPCLADDLLDWIKDIVWSVELTKERSFCRLETLIFKLIGLTDPAQLHNGKSVYKTHPAVLTSQDH